VGGRPQYASGLLPALRKVMREEGFWAFWKVSRGRERGREDSIGWLYMVADVGVVVNK